MDELDKAIADVAYILDSLRLLRDIERMGDCNTCAAKNGCDFAPKCGERVRYNCPFYKKEGE